MMPPFPGIEFRHLRYFLAASDHGSFRRANLIHGIQQCAISRRIRDLEDRLGASLFQRSPGSVRLTLAGERFQTHARSVWDSIQRGKSEISAIRSGVEGQMRVRLMAPIAGGFLLDLLKEFSRHCLAVYIGLVGGALLAHVEALSRLDLDIAFLAGSQTWYGCEGAVLWSERVYAYLADWHPLAERAELTWTDLQGETIIVPDDALGEVLQISAIARCSDAGQRPAIRRHRSGFENLLATVALGTGVCLATAVAGGESFPGVARRSIKNEMIPFAGVWSAGNDNPKLR